MLALILQLDATPMAMGSSLRMVDVGGDDHAAAGDFVADQLGRELFLVGDEVHFFGDDALARVVHLGEVPGGVFRLAAGEPVCARLGDGVAVIAGAIGSHGSPRVRNSVSIDYNRVGVRRAGEEGFHHGGH